MTGKACAFCISAAMTVSVPGTDRGELEVLVAAAHEVCPYSNATRGSVDVSCTIA